MVQPTFTGPVVSELKFTGLGTFPPGGPPYSGAAALVVSKDNHAVNGVLHIIDKVLLASIATIIAGKPKSKG
jgi:hypothetical protein